MNAEREHTKREPDNMLGEIITHTITLSTEAGTLVFETNEAGDLIFDAPRWEPSPEAWRLIAEAAVDHETPSVEDQLRALRHPGNTATINGVHVKREALRYVIGGCCAYDVADAAGLVRRCSAYLESEATDSELVDFALSQGATREYVADADTDRLIADYGETFAESRRTQLEAGIATDADEVKVSRAQLAKLLDYIEPSERADYERTNTPVGHIYNTIRKLRASLES